MKSTCVFKSKLSRIEIVWAIGRSTQKDRILRFAQPLRSHRIDIEHKLRKIEGEICVLCICLSLLTSMNCACVLFVSFELSVGDCIKMADHEMCEHIYIRNTRLMLNVYAYIYIRVYTEANRLGYRSMSIIINGV